MNWFKENPFLGILSASCAVLLLLAGYFLYDAQGRYNEQVEKFEQLNSSFEQLQRNKPFPNDANVRALQEEKDQAVEMLRKIGASVQVQPPASTPQNFQDSLRTKVSDIISRAQTQGVDLGPDFFLGFKEYEAKLPSTEAAPLLSLQLASIYNVASILVDSKVREISSITRNPLPVELGEHPKNEKTPNKKDAKSSDNQLPELALAPFEVNFSSDQSAFQTSFNRILSAKPFIFVRLVGVTNSSIEPPKKGGTGDHAVSSAEQDKEDNLIKPILGREHVNVNLRLASISATTSKGAK